MIGLESLRWLLTVAFGSTAVFHLVRCLRPIPAWPSPAAEHRVSETLHLVMGLSMIVMIWPWGEIVPMPVWIVLFALSTGWFVARTVWATRRRAVPAFFATVMATMVWMGASVPAQATAGDHAGMAMAGMQRAPIGYAGWCSALLGGYLVLAALWWAGRGMRIGGLATATAVSRPLGWPALCHAVMSAGMGVALLTMI